MTAETSTRVQIAALIYSMTNAVLFGAGLVLVLSLPVLNAAAGFWISVVVAASLVLSAPIAWWMAPRLRAPIALRDRACTSTGRTGATGSRRPG